MIQPTTENKYRFDMLVSARAMGSPALSSAPGVTAPRHRFSIFKQGIVLTGREPPAETDGRATLPCFGSGRAITRKSRALGLAKTTEQ
jgi:hypothetical protein